MSIVKFGCARLRLLALANWRCNLRPTGWSRAAALHASQLEIIEAAQPLSLILIWPALGTDWNDFIGSLARYRAHYLLSPTLKG